MLRALAASSVTDHAAGPGPQTVPPALVPEPSTPASGRPSKPTTPRAPPTEAMWDANLPESTVHGFLDAGHDSGFTCSDQASFTSRASTGPAQEEGFPSSKRPHTFEIARFREKPWLSRQESPSMTISGAGLTLSNRQPGPTPVALPTISQFGRRLKRSW